MPGAPELSSPACEAIPATPAAPPTPTAPATPAVRLEQRMASSAVVLTARRLLLTSVSAISSAIIARLIGPAAYGPFVSALTIFAFALGFVDFGFSLYLAREMARAPERRAALLAATLQVQLFWSVLATAGVIAVALLDGGSREAILLVVAPAVLASGLAGYRQIFYVTYRIRELTWIDLPVGLIQYGAMVAAAALHRGVLAVAAAFCAGTVINTLAVAARGHAIVAPRGAGHAERHRVIRLSGGMGISSLMATVYFGLDLVILGWLVSDAQLGDYAVAVKVLSILVLIPGLVMSAVYPGLSTAADDPAAQARLAARVWHWLIVAGLPGSIGIAVFARPIVLVAFGSAYAAAIGSVRVLALAAALALLSNFTGMVMMSRRLVRPQLIQNSVAITVNFAGNVILVPRFGIIAAAWLTVASEAIVVAGGAWTLRHRLDIRPIVRVTARPGAVVALAALAAETGLMQSSATGAVAYLAVLGLGAFVLRAWPAELCLPILRTTAGRG